jgi:HEAT repeat protein
MGLVRRSQPDPCVGAAVPAAGVDYADLVARLESSDAGARRRAARDLAAYPAAVPALCARLGRESALSVRTVLFTTLIRLKSPDVVNALVRFLRVEDAALRNDTIEALQEMPDEIGPCIETLLRDCDSDVRILSIQVLSALRHPEAPRWLTRIVMEDPHVNVCGAAVDCLAEIGGEDALPHLQALKRRFADEPFISFAADAATRRITGR